MPLGVDTCRACRLETAAVGLGLLVGAPAARCLSEFGEFSVPFSVAVFVILVAGEVG